jgi:magnesium chelatase family protein
MGIEAYEVTVEVDATGGLPGFCMVGLPDSAVKESRDRVFSALKNSGFSIPSKRITVNLAPADIRKAGSAFDLPIALGILIASQQIEPYCLNNTITIGELSLDGTVKPVRGTLSIAMFARKKGCQGLILPEQNVNEAGVISEMNLYPVHNLSHVIEVIKNPVKYKGKWDALSPDLSELSCWENNFSDIKGQEQAKRACEISASGAHNFLLIGSPGCGKSLIARRLPSILPTMSQEESLTTTMIHSSAGILKGDAGLVKRRPFRSPHHTISNMALVGGGAYPKPGEVSLAHNGVLFLDELPEFQKAVLEALRQPLEDGVVTIARTSITLSFPCRSMLGAAMNPCPCGFLLDPQKDCVCRPKEIKQYLSRISGPLLDRIDIQLEMPVLSYDELSNKNPGESSEKIRARVEAAREIQLGRFKDIPEVFCNSHMDTRHIRQYCQLEDSAALLFKNVIEKIGLSARAYDRILRVARTIADLAQSENIKDEYLAEAIHYRSLDRTSRFFG